MRRHYLSDYGGWQCQTTLVSDTHTTTTIFGVGSYRSVNPLSVYCTVDPKGRVVIIYYLSIATYCVLYRLMSKDSTF